MMRARCSGPGERSPASRIAGLSRGKSAEFFGIVWPFALDPRPFRASLATLFCAAALVACGGGGGESAVGSDGVVNPPTQTPPTAGVVQTPPAVQTPAAYTVSGSISIAETSAIDSDTNDPQQANRKSNNAFDSLQALGNPVLAAGYLNVPGQGPAGPSQAGGDLVDGYAVELAQGQVIELEFSADPAKFDVDLFVYDEQRNLVGQSIGVNTYECVTISEPGVYAVASSVYTVNGASTGGSVYQLRIGSPGDGSSCNNTTVVATANSNGGEIVAGEVIAIAHEQPMASQALSNKAIAGFANPVLLKGVLGRGRPALLKVPNDAGLVTQQGSVSKSNQGSAEILGLSGLVPPRTRDVLRTLTYTKALRRSGLYAAVEPNRVVQSHQVQAFPPNDRLYSTQRWHYESISLPSAINLLAGLSPQPTNVPIVAVVDTGIVIDHPEFAGQLVPGYDFVVSIGQNIVSGDGDGIDPNPDDAGVSPLNSYHGSHVAGTVAARTYNGTLGAGVAPMAKIMPIRVLGSTGFGTSYAILQGIAFAAGLPNDSGTVPEQRADVINLSLGFGAFCDETTQATITAARGANTIVVGTSGNKSRQGLMPVETPGNCVGVVSIGATGPQRQRASYSNGGANLIAVAPGGDAVTSTSEQVFSTLGEVLNGVRQPSFGPMQGTSMAAPHAAGVFALMRFVLPGITPAQIDDLISSGAILDDLGPTGRDNEYGYGQINAHKAVLEALRLAGEPAPPALSGRIEAIPSVLNMGAVRNEIEFELGAASASGERVISVAGNSPSISVRAKEERFNPSTGLGTYIVTANRGGSASTVFTEVVVTLAPNRVITIPVTVLSTSRAGGGSLGPVYVLVLDRSSGESAPVAQTVVSAPVGGLYRYQLNVPGIAKISIIAGNDIDNDGGICNNGEGCGGYPLLGSQIEVLEPGANLTEIDFSISPFGGIGTQSSATIDALINTGPKQDTVSSDLKRFQ